MNALHAAWKMARGVVHAVCGLLIIAVLFPRATHAERNVRVQVWARRMLALVDIGLEVHGQPPAAGPMLLVANHISWLDILMMLAAGHCRFVSKSEVRRWPLIGTLATGAGTLYIERGSRRDAMRVVHSMAERLTAGDILAIFPEGTTSDGVAVLAFHGNLLQAAISARVPAQPVALAFVETATGVPSQLPCYIGDDTLLASIWRTLAGPPLTAVISYGQPQRGEGRDRRAWAADLRAEVLHLRGTRFSRE
ncbi:MAG: lysophospholipid acyltransferase family protein [Ramlibacter sp.]